MREEFVCSRLFHLASLFHYRAISEQCLTLRDLIDLILEEQMHLFVSLDLVIALFGDT